MWRVKFSCISRIIRLCTYETYLHLPYHKFDLISYRLRFLTVSWCYKIFLHPPTLFSPHFILNFPPIKIPHYFRDCQIQCLPSSSLIKCFCDLEIVKYFTRYWCKSFDVTNDGRKMFGFSIKPTDYFKASLSKVLEFLLLSEKADWKG